MINLLDETIEALQDYNKSPSDVIWVGDDKKYMTWDEFAFVANKLYDDGYGHPEVNQYLKVVGEDFWLERYEYDGSEWWRYKTMPIRPQEHFVFQPFYSKDEIWWRN